MKFQWAIFYESVNIPKRVTFLLVGEATTLVRGKRFPERGYPSPPLNSSRVYRILSKTRYCELTLIEIIGSNKIERQQTYKNMIL